MQRADPFSRDATSRPLRGLGWRVAFIVLSAAAVVLLLGIFRAEATAPGTLRLVADCRSRRSLGWQRRRSNKPSPPNCS